ncbi:MAG: glucose-6-phosphate isomerase [Erysipelotrichaceae bacterium]
MIKFDAKFGLLNQEINSYQDVVSKAHKELHNKTGKGSDFLGWLDWSQNYDKAEFERIKKCAERIRNDAEILLVCGIGGSYLGARSAIEMIQGLFPKRNLEIIYVGNTFSSTYLNQVLAHIKGKSVYLNVISKSGTTTETAVAFRILRQYIEETYKEKASERIIATTDKQKGVLKAQAVAAGYETFIIPDDIGGRFSVITPVGLLPLAVAGVDIDEIMRGYCAASDLYSTADLKDNPAYQYAVARRILNEQNKEVETLVTYESNLVMVGEWWKQLFGESEGKNERGMLPTAVNYSTDLHSLGQFVQDGRKVLFETLLLVEKPMCDSSFPSDKENLDGLNYLNGKSLDWINKMACKGTLAAHYEEGRVPNLIISLADTSEYSYGMMIYFFFKAIAMTTYLLNENPFNQPGVEVYKKRMFALLGKEN